MAVTYIVPKFLTQYFSYEIFMKHLLLKNTSLQLNIGTMGQCVSQVIGWDLASLSSLPWKSWSLKSGKVLYWSPARGIRAQHITKPIFFKSNANTVILGVSKLIWRTAESKPQHTAAQPLKAPEADGLPGWGFTSVFQFTLHCTHDKIEVLLWKAEHSSCQLMGNAHGGIYVAELLPVNHENPRGLVLQTEKCAQQ